MEFCSTFPYEENDIEAAKAFIDEHIAEDETETQIGSVKFTLYTTIMDNGTDIALSVVYSPEE